MQGFDGGLSLLNDSELDKAKTTGVA